MILLQSGANLSYADNIVPGPINILFHNKYKGIAHKQVKLLWLMNASEQCQLLDVS